MRSPLRGNFTGLVSVRSFSIFLLAAMICLGLSFSVKAQKYRFFSPTITDWSVFSFPAAGGQVRWFILQNQNPSTGSSSIADIPWGQSVTDSIPANGDYTGNGLSDPIVYRNSSGTPANTYILKNPDNSASFQQWGNIQSDRIGVEGDYDGDGKMDMTIARPSGPNFQWWVLNSSDHTVNVFYYGLTATDFPLPGADYTGDGKDDPTVARTMEDGQIIWFVGTNAGQTLSQTYWGDYDTDFIVSGGDYDGDGKADFMVWRAFGSGTNAVWYLRTSSGDISYTQFGISGPFSTRDTALRAGDYDGDGKTDIAVYRPSTLTFWVFRSSGGVQTQKWGIEGNNNIPNASFGIF